MTGIENNANYRYMLVCDIDNCYVDSREWLKHMPEDETSREGWDNLITLHHLVKPNQTIVNLVVSASKVIPVFFLTAREDRKESRKNTIRQIEAFSGGDLRVTGDNPNAVLIMRKEFDYRPSCEVKEDMLKGLIRYNWIPLLVIDDEDSNCQMFLRYGIPVMKYDIYTDKIVDRYFPEYLNKGKDIGLLEGLFD